MKTLRGALAVLLAAALLPLDAAAAPAGVYTLEELRMEVTVPEGMTVFLKDTAAEDPDAEGLELDGAALAQVMEDQSAYLLALPQSGDWEVGVLMQETEEFQAIFDFNLFGEAVLEEWAQAAFRSYEELGYSFQKSSLWQGEQARFLVADSTQTQGEETILRRQYYTIYNGQAIHLTLVVYDGAFTEEQTQALESMVESLRFTETLPVPQEARQAAAKLRQEEQGSGAVWVKALTAGLAGGLLTYFMSRKKHGAPAKEEERDEYGE